MEEKRENRSLIVSYSRALGYTKRETKCHYLIGNISSALGTDKSDYPYALTIGGNAISDIRAIVLDNGTIHEIRHHW